MVHAAIRHGQNVAALAAPAVPPITLDPANTSPLLTLSAGDLRATRNAGSRWVSSRVTVSRSGQLVYFEATTMAGAGVTILGACNTTFNEDDGASQCFLGNVQGGTATSIGMISNGVDIYSNGVVVAGGFGSWNGIGQVGQFCIDQVANLFWARGTGGLWNGSGAADPASGVGGLALPANMVGVPIFAGVSVFNDPNSIQINVGGSAFTGSIPAGFSAYQ